jgi:hypothetical protein
LFTAASIFSDALFAFFFDIRTVYQKQQFTMKTSSVLTFLACILLSFLIAPSYSYHGGKGKGKGKGKGYYPPPAPPYQPPPVPAPHPAPAPRFQTCQETCAPFAGTFLHSCNLNGCIGYFDCANLPLSAGFQNQQQCISYCISFVNLQCPQVNGSSSDRCEAARCTT